MYGYSKRNLAKGKAQRSQHIFKLKAKQGDPSLQESITCYKTCILKNQRTSTSWSKLEYSEEQSTSRKEKGQKVGKNYNIVNKPRKPKWKPD